MDYQIPDNETDETCYIRWSDGYRSVHDSKIKHRVYNLPYIPKERDAIHTKEIKIQLAKEKIAELNEEIKEHRQRIKHSKTTKKILEKDLTHKIALLNVPKGGTLLVLREFENDTTYRIVED